MRTRSPHPVQAATTQVALGKRRGLVAGVLFMVWLAAVTVPLTYLTAFHTVPLPAPNSAYKAVKMPHGERWRMVHVLAADCGCSARLGKYLLGRGKLPEVDETVWLIGEEDSLMASLQRSGFKVEKIDSEALANEHGIQGVPWLLVERPSGEIVYSGGYSNREAQGSRDYEDVSLLKTLRQGPNSIESTRIRVCDIKSPPPHDGSAQPQSAASSSALICLIL